MAGDIVFGGRMGVLGTVKKEEKEEKQIQKTIENAYALNSLEKLIVTNYVKNLTNEAEILCGLQKLATNKKLDNIPKKIEEKKRGMA